MIIKNLEKKLKKEEERLKSFSGNPKVEYHKSMNVIITFILGFNLTVGLAFFGRYYLSWELDRGVMTFIVMPPIMGICYLLVAFVRRKRLEDDE